MARSPLLQSAYVALVTVLVATLPRLASAQRATIDKEVAKMWSSEAIEPAPISRDSEFIRRVTLDLIGRVPTTAESADFFADRTEHKRANLVDRLLASREYAAYWADIYTDVFLGRAARIAGKKSEPFTGYLETAFAENRAYDEIVRELLVADGNAMENGAAGYIVARGFMGANTEQLAGTTAQLFLGAQIQCAQCHDHPYDARFKQEDFATFAAFFGQTRARRQDKVFVLSEKKIPLRAKERPGFKKRLAKRPSLIYAVTEPRFFATKSEQRPGETRRQWLARAILAQDELAQVTVNRVWKQLFGSAIGTPWNDLGYLGDSAKRPALLTSLASDFQKSNYDHKALVRAIALSSAYQRTSTGAPSQDDEKLETMFAKSRVRPLSADQLFRSITTATSLENAANRKLRRRVSEQARRKTMRPFLSLFTDDEGGTEDGFSGSVPQALMLLNGRFTNAATRGAAGTTLANALRATDKRSRIRALFAATYSREPTAAELASLESLPNTRAAFQDLLHSLLISTEFTTNH